jgi:LmbE family N-acetylglucosaminyl deacetylase
LEELRQARRILCVQPHYDDNDLCAGGTLAALHDEGAELVYVTVTDDLVGVLDPALSSEEADRRLKADQAAVVRLVRLLRPDFVFTCDPWLPYEAHQDHIRTGLAVAEASILYNLLRFRTDPAVDSAYQPYQVTGFAFYAAYAPNIIFDISACQERKHNALSCYRAQFSPADLVELHASLEARERQAGAGAGFLSGEPLKLLAPQQLHLDPGAWRA